MTQYDNDLWRSVEDAQEDPDDGPELTLADLSAIMARASHAQSRIDEINATARMECERIEHWRERTTESDAMEIAAASQQAETYLRRHLAHIDEVGDRTAKRSVTTPYGTVQSRTTSAQPVVTDPEALREWARASIYEREPKPREADWARIKRDGKIVGTTLTLAGQAVPGVKIEPATTHVTVQIYGDS